MCLFWTTLTTLIVALSSTKTPPAPIGIGQPTSDPTNEHCLVINQSQSLILLSYPDKPLSFMVPIYHINQQPFTFKVIVDQQNNDWEIEQVVTDNHTQLLRLTASKMPQNQPITFTVTITTKKRPKTTIKQEFILEHWVYNPEPTITEESAEASPPPFLFARSIKNFLILVMHSF